MTEARIPRVGEEVEFIGRNNTLGTVTEIENHGKNGGYDWVDVWVKTDDDQVQGKRIVVAVSPLELRGMRTETE